MKQEIKGWAKKVWLDLRSYDPDTVPVRIKGNREKMKPHMVGLATLSTNMPPADKVLFDKAVDLLNDYYHYFDEGYRSFNNIDTLPDKCYQALITIIEAN